MKFTKGYTTADQVVRTFIASQGKNYLHDYVQYLLFLLDELRNQQQDTIHGVRTKVLPMTHRKTIEFPDDYIRYSKVGVQLGDRIIAFVPDASLAFTQKKAFKKSAPFKLLVQTTADYTYEFVNVYREGEMLGSVLAQGFGYQGANYFKINEQEKEIQFEAIIPRTNIYLEYISNGFDPSVQTELASPQVELAIAGIEKRIAKYKFGSNSAHYNAAKQNYTEEETRYRNRTSDITLEAILNAAQSNYSQAPKL